MDPQSQIQNAYKSAANSSLPTYPEMTPLSKDIPPWKTIKNLSPLGKIIILVLILIVLSGAAYFSKDKLFKRDYTSKQPTDIIAMVGEEKIYKSDIELGAQYYPQIATDSANTNNSLIVEQLIEDSLILQAAREKNIASLSAEIFNSPNKVYPKRITTVIQSKKALSENLEPYLAGEYAAIFYDNRPNGKNAATIAKDKQIAFDKMSKLYEQVKNKQLTVKQASEAIKNDTSLKVVDEVYKRNAFGEFRVTQDDINPTFVKEFNLAVASLQPGDLTPLILGKDRDLQTKQEYDAIYIFGTITQREDSKQNTRDYLNQLRSKYNVTYY